MTEPYTCADCGNKLSVTDRIWYLNQKAYCLICGAKERNKNA